MENTKILKIENKINDIKIELQQVREAVGFDDLLLEYKDIKRQEWAAKRACDENEDIEKTDELEINFKKLSNRKNELIKELDKVTNVEEKLYSQKKSITSIISSLDEILNYYEYKDKVLKEENLELEKLLDQKYLEGLAKEISNKQKEIEIFEKDIQKLKLEKKPFRFISFKIKSLQKEISKINKVISNANNYSREQFDAKIEKDKPKFELHESKITKFREEIDYSLKLLEEVDSHLKFIDDDEIDHNSSFVVKYLDVFYGSKQALFDVNIKFPKNKVISIIGPSGCGKSTFLRTLNRINDNIPNFKAEGKILLDGEYDIYKLKSVRNRYDKIELSTLRTKVGMIFQQPNPFPMTIAKNVQYGPKVKGIKNKVALNDITEKSLKDAGLWEEVKDNLKALGTSLSGGQQQRLCIARAIANEPEILLMDEPTSALDPIASKKIEELIVKLKKHYTIIMVTHSMQQAQRISDFTAFFYQGVLIEYGKTKQIFENPKEKETMEYISGKFG